MESVFDFNAYLSNPDFLSMDDANEMYDLNYKSLKKRMKKTLYYGENSRVDRVTVPLAEIAVGLFDTTDSLDSSRLNDKHSSKIMRQKNLTPCAFMLGMIYIERIMKSNPDYVKQNKASEIFLIAMVLASKFLYDEGEEEEFYNDEWASFVGLDTDRVNCLEKDFLEASDWKLFVTANDFFSFLQQLERRIAFKQGSQRGWFSYADLEVLFQSPDLQQRIMGVASHFIQAIGVCILAYIACMYGVLLFLSLHQGIQQHAQHFGLPPSANQVRTSATDGWHSKPHQNRSSWLPPTSEPCKATFLPQASDFVLRFTTRHYLTV